MTEYKYLIKFYNYNNIHPKLSSILKSEIAKHTKKTYSNNLALFY